MLENYVNVLVVCNDCGYFAHHVCKGNQIPKRCFDCKSQDLDCEIQDSPLEEKE
jgi:predicted Zn-ribbon and HTH transcriptional regulator